MREESGRSLIEIIGVMAIAGVMTLSALGIYNTIRTNQIRTIANADLEKIVENTKLLMELRGTYNGISVDYLIKAGALNSNKAPIGGDDWSITSSVDGETFSINLVDLTRGECEYFSTTKPKWANQILINGFEDSVSDNCFNSDTNQISFIAK